MSAREAHRHEPGSQSSEFRLEEYFVGRTRAWGIFRDRFRRLRRRFEVAIAGDWDGETLTLAEDFSYDDGQTERRIWRIRKVGESAYEGEADAVLGQATGAILDGAVNWRYRFALPVGGRSLKVRFDDWLFPQSDGVVINRADVFKLGIRLGEVTLVFRKIDDQQVA